MNSHALHEVLFSRVVMLIISLLVFFGFFERGLQGGTHYHALWVYVYLFNRFNGLTNLHNKVITNMR